MPAMKAKSVRPKTTGRPRMNPRPTTAASGMPVFACSDLSRWAYGIRSVNSSGSRGCKSREPLFKAVFVEQLPDAFFGRQIKMPVALRADHRTRLDFLFEDGGLALWTLNPQAFGNIGFLPAALAIVC